MERRLAAILAADMVGYSRLMGEDEVGTLQRLTSLRRELVQPQIIEHSGRIVKLTGDGLLTEFPSVVEAVQCAVDIQEGLAEREPDLPDSRRIRLRIGINLGDIIVEGSDIYGDGVNVAARLEALASPGGICVSGTVFDHVKGKVGLDFADLGYQQVKNIAQPVRVYEVALHKRSDGGEAAGDSAASAKLALPDKPSIVVLPFVNMSGDSEQEYFSDGITEDIITELSRFRSLFVIARNSSFAFRGKVIDITEVGKKLGVRYVVEGSVRRAAKRVRITAQLIDAPTGNHIWAERYDRELDDIFLVQEEVARIIVATLVGRLDAAAEFAARAKPTDDLGAYDFVLRAQHYMQQYTKKDYSEARLLLEKAIERDPGFARAYGLLALVRVYEWFWEMAGPGLEQAIELGRKAVELDDQEACAHVALCVAEEFSGRLDQAEYHIGRATDLNPNDDLALVEKGRLWMYLGHPDEGAQFVLEAMRLNPYHPNWYWNILGRTLHTAARFEEAIAAFKRITTPTFWIHAYLAACNACVGSKDEAELHRAETLRLRPDFTIELFAKILPYQRAEMRERFLDTLRNAGIPE